MVVGLVFSQLLTVLFLTARADDVVTIHVTPRVVLAGQGAVVSLICRVPRHADNRWLEYGLEGHTASVQQLDGASARVMWELKTTPGPCGKTQAFCSVTRVHRRAVRVSTSVTVAGCSESSGEAA